MSKRKLTTGCVCLSGSLVSAELRKEIMKDNEAFEKEKKDWTVKEEEKTIGTAVREPRLCAASASALL